MTENTIIFEQWMIDILDKSQENSFAVMVEQMKTNPDAIQALYE